MGNDCSKAKGNVYFQCRKSAALYNDKLYSREGAAELLGVSVSSLADYELGNTKVVPVDKVVLMSDLYNAPQLLNLYCQNDCPIGCRKTFATEIKSIEGLTLKMVDLMNGYKLKDSLEKLIHIAIDGKIDRDEISEMKAIVNVLNEISFVSDEIKLMYEKQAGIEKCSL